MKKLLSLCLIMLSLTISANEGVKCADDALGVLEQISLTTSCYNASQIAKSCAMGSSIDTQLAGKASNICLKEAGKISSSDKKLMKKMISRCNKAYAKKEGTIFLSMRAFCELDAIKFITDLNLATEF